MLPKRISLVGLILVVAPALAMAAPRKWRVSDPALARSLIAQGGKLIANYGSFQIIESSSTAVARADSSRMQPADDLNWIELNTGPVDTSSPQVRALAKPVGFFAGKRLRLVQFVGPVKPAWFAALKRSGVQIVTYIPQNAYLVYGNADALKRMQAWAQTATDVQWEGDYADNYKINPRARLAAAQTDQQSPGTDWFAVQMVDDAKANPATLALIGRLKLAPVKQQFRVLGYRNVIVQLPPDQLDQLAAQPDVVSVQPYVIPQKLDERQDQIVAGQVAAGLPTGPGYLAWLAGIGFSQTQFDASGFVVDLADSGIDNGTTQPGHFGLYTLGDPSLPSRVAYNRLEGIPNPGSTLAGCDGHGNLNAHVIGGYCGFTNGFPFTDAAGFEYGLGECPFVKLGSSVIFDPDSFTYPDYPDLESDAYAGGARISANSWGVDEGGLYTATAQAYDALVRDAQPAGSTHAAAGNQPMVILFAAGNDGAAAETIDSPGSAKNVLTVGAAENVRSLSPANGGNDSAGRDGCGTPDSEADDANDMASFSSRGPCADGRLKPDLVAPGTHITGGVPQAGTATTNGTGAALGCFDASGVAALPGAGECNAPSPGNPANFFPLGQEFYTVASGTSVAVPAVAGACALLRQYFINQGWSPPSPAMTKAWLMNSTRYLTGSGANDALWSPNQGMGELDLGLAFDGVPRLFSDQVSTDKFTATGQTRYFTGTLSDLSKPFRVTLAWTDAPGSTTGNAFNNDLDLTVAIGGKTYLGNVFNGPYSTTGGTYDRADNVESVFLPAGQGSNFVVTVTAADINSDGVPNEPPSLDQDFALVLYNAVSSLAPIIKLGGARLTGESYSPTNGVIDPGETVTVAFALKNIGTADASHLTATLLATNGVMFPGGPQPYGALTAGGEAVTQAFSFTAVGPCGGSIRPVLKLSDGLENLGEVRASFPLGKRVVATTSGTNANLIQIPGTGTSGPAAPYPSAIRITGVTGTVSQVTVSLLGVSHTYPADIDALLVGPNGTNVMLMANCGYNNPVNGATLTFADSAASALPYSSAITSGSYRPTDYAPQSESFFAPAPPGPFGQNLAVFNGRDPNGLWLLYVQDTGAQDGGSIGDGWRLSITTSNNICVLEPPLLSPVTLTNGVVTLHWKTIPGRIYCVEYNDDLSSTNWICLGSDVTATNLTASQSAPWGAATQRFYRVVLLP